MAPDLYYWGRRLTCMIAFIRDEDQRRRSVIHRARVDVVEWLGDKQLAYLPYEAPERIQRQTGGARTGSTRSGRGRR